MQKAMVIHLASVFGVNEGTAYDDVRMVTDSNAKNGVAG
jgi:hypothetical protein